MSVGEKNEAYDQARLDGTSDTSESDGARRSVTGTIKELDGNVITNVTGGVIAANDDDKHTRNLPMEHYAHYAAIQREFENRKDYEGLKETQMQQLSDPQSNLSIAKIESQRELRRASPYAVFFLITTDILGPSNAPYGIRQLGYVGGIILYIAFGIFAMIGGKLLNMAFLKLDSDNYPIRTFSDLASRILGPWSRYFIAGLQFIQMILNVGIICLTTGQALAQCINSTADDPKLCFTVQILVWALLGMILGQIRSLRDFSHLANSAVWMNIAICIITMVGAARWDPYYVVTGLAPGPVVVSAGAPAGSTLFDKMLGVDQMVFAWGGATIFLEVMAEMARPREFVYGMVGADMLIMIVYLFFGIFVYSFQGQYVYVVANQGINPYGLRLAGNILTIVSGMLAATLYGNVGLKVLYQGFGVPDLGFPALTSRRGILLWAVLVVAYWGVAFIIGAAIPQVNSLSSLVGSLCILNFSYSLPALFMLALMMREDASQLDSYDPLTGSVTRHDTWGNRSRWRRAIASGTWKRHLAKLFLVIMFLGGLTLCGIGMYGAIKNMITTYGGSSSAGKAFSCSPANYN
nr:Mtr.2 [Starmerella bombicola]